MEMVEHGNDGVLARQYSGHHGLSVEARAYSEGTRRRSHRVLER
jgi:hypothetical protein